MQSLRFADARTVTQYPLEIPFTADWQAAESGWDFTIELTDLAKGDIVAPSLSVLDQPDYGFQFTLEIDDKLYPLAPVPAEASHRQDPNPSDNRVRTAIDCFHLGRRAKRARLHCHLSTVSSPEHYLLAVSIRPTQMKIEAAEGASHHRLALPPARSQMLENPRIAGGICSPISTAMALGSHRPAVDTGQIIRDCFDPSTRMYGSWPLAVRSAARIGCIGAVEVFSSWTPIMDCLRAGLPVVASIRFGAGELPGAPMASTAGHLVVVYGVTDEGVLVNDPAAPNHGTVSRSYPLIDFSRAWFRHRGAGYILCP